MGRTGRSMDGRDVERTGGGHGEGHGHGEGRENGE